MLARQSWAPRFFLVVLTLFTQFKDALDALRYQCFLKTKYKGLLAIPLLERSLSVCPSTNLPPPPSVPQYDKERLNGRMEVIHSPSPLNTTVSHPRISGQIMWCYSICYSPYSSSYFGIVLFFSRTIRSFCVV